MVDCIKGSEISFLWGSRPGKRGDTSQSLFSLVAVQNSKKARSIAAWLSGLGDFSRVETGRVRQHWT